MKNPTKEDFEKAIANNKKGGTIAWRADDDEIKGQASACYELAKQMQPKWIPVSERLPENSETGKPFIVLYRNKEQDVCLWTTVFGNAGFYANSVRVTVDVTHWQPTLSPPAI